MSNYRLKQQEKILKEIERHGYVWAMLIDDDGYNRFKYVGNRIMWIKP